MGWASGGDSWWRAAVTRPVASYRAAPLARRVVVDLAAVTVVLALGVGVALSLRGDEGPRVASAAGERAPTIAAPKTMPTASLPTTATSTSVPSTTVPTGAKAAGVAPTTTTTTPPSTAPPTTPAPPTTAPARPPAPPTTATTRPTTTTTEPTPRYEDCDDALRDGALPLSAGDPGYGRHLDRDGDGEACNSWRDWEGAGGGT
jgi:hypothetical protein